MNASPLILLGKVRRLGLLAGLCDELLVPEAVASEVAAGPEGAALVGELARVDRTRYFGVPAILPRVEAWDLGLGESQVLTAVAERPGSRAVLDDRAARRCAQVLGLPVIGTVGIVLRARKKGLIARARPILSELERSGLYLTESVREEALARVGE
ncbi:MAG TPA: DUF3368 domain-containing protein [Thermoanaerobaculia bacterium]|nr:DUF3368 domain-containing protein [Thermoanaerobaculia bacterium]